MLANIKETYLSCAYFIKQLFVGVNMVEKSDVSVPSDLKTEHEKMYETGNGDFQITAVYHTFLGGWENTCNLQFKT